MTLSRFLKTYDTLIAAAAGFYVVYLFTKYSGAGISPDSIMYTSAARNFAAHGTLITFNQTTITDFPVFYPVFLGAILWVTGIDPIIVAPVLNGILFAAVIFLSGWIVQRFEPSAWIYKWLMLIAIVLSPAMLTVFTYLWSETLFMLISLFFLVVARQYLVKHTAGWLVAMALLAALSCITRYAGVTIIGTGGLLLLLDRAIAIKTKIWHIIVYSVLSVSLVVANLVMNAVLTGRTTGPREASVTPFLKNVYYTGTVLCDWAGFSDKTYPFATLVVALLFAGLAFLIVYHYIKKRVHTYQNLAVTFTFVYGAFIIISSTLSRYERINTRLMAPLFIALLFSCTFWVIRLIKDRNIYIKTVLTLVCSGLILGFCYMELQEDLQRYDDEMDYGIPGYTDDSWNKSQFANYLRKDTSLFKPGIPVYSDANEALYFTSGMYVKLLPHRYFQNTISRFYQLKQFYLVWFKDMDNPELISLKDIEKVKKLKLLKQFPEGAIYLCDGK